MTFTDAAAEVLRLVGRPLHYKEITDIAIEKNLLSHVGKSPEVTMGARLAATLKKETDDNPLVRVKPGVFALRAWDEKTIRAGLDQKKGSKRPARTEPPPARGRRKAGEGAAAGDGAEAAEEQDGEGGEEPEAAGADAAEGDDELVAAAETPRRPAAEAPRRAHAEAPAPRAPAQEDLDPPGPDEAMRAEAAAGAAEMFDEEEDDDQPILGGEDRPAAAGAAGAVDGDGRRRRRRRRRGRSNGEVTPAAGNGGGGGGGGGGLPSYTATPAFDTPAPAPVAREPRPDRHEGRGRDRNDGRDRSNSDRDRDRGNADRASADRANADRASADRASADRALEARDLGEAAYRGPQVIELTGGDGHALDDLAGRDLADAVAVVLSTFDRNAGAVSLRQIAETAQRRGRLVGDAQLVQSQVAAAVRADNARRITAGQRTRFRLAGGRVALTDWLLTGELARFEQEALAAVERYRDASRRAFARKLAELPGHAFVEICVLALERVGVSQLRAVRRPGAPSGEAHFSGALRTVGDEMRIALVIRRDGREVGRERVTELRGSLHHYGPALAGWILTSGQMLSGAREEAAIAGAAPIALHDGLAVARLCEDNDVAVLRARLPIAIPDVDLLEALRAS